MQIGFSCTECGRRLFASAAAADLSARCPACQCDLIVPNPHRYRSQVPGEMMARPVSGGVQPLESVSAVSCPKCGVENRESTIHCIQCGYALREAVIVSFEAGDDGTAGGLIPYKNPKALWAYYLGVFSMIPIFGLPLGLAALGCGVNALNHAKEHPEARGKVHAWVGIIMGTFFALFYSLLVAMAVVGIVGSM